MGTPSGSPFSPLVTSFRRHLRARNLSPKTIEIYLGAAAVLQSWLESHSAASSWDEVRKADLETWLGGLLSERSAGHASNQYRAVQQFFKWLTAEEEITANPMIGMSPPKVEEKLVPVLTEAQRTALLKTCKGNDFTNRRDMAILRLFLATGIRLAEMTGIRVEDVDLDRRLVRVEGKGRRERVVRFDGGTAGRRSRSTGTSGPGPRPSTRSGRSCGWPRRTGACSVGPASTSSSSAGAS
jgi:integrase/recombinase XerC